MAQGEYRSAKHEGTPVNRRPRVVTARKRVLPTGAVYTLHPGEVACANQGERLETLLGSCVSIVLTDPRRTIGVMCHIVHAKQALAGAANTGAYAAVALEAMYGLLLSRGVAPKLCEAFVFGGGNMFPDLVREDHVGNANARWALDALAADGIHVVFHDLGGTTYRKLGWTVGPEAPQVNAVEV